MEKEINLIIILIILYIFPYNISFSDEFIPIKIGVIEGLAEHDSTSSIRYKDIFESSLYYSIGENEKKVNQCGYKFIIYKYYYEASNPVGVINSSNQSKNDDLWFIYGPRRSEDYQKIIKTNLTTVLISPMAEYFLLENKNLPVFSMYSSINELVLVSISEVLKREYKKKYASIVDVTCIACREFDRLFDIEILKSNKYKKIFTIDITKDYINYSIIDEYLKINKPDFIILPNSSKISGEIISHISKNYKDIKFVGSNGWGDDIYGFLTKQNIPNYASGFCTRLGTQSSIMSKEFNVNSLNYVWDDSIIAPSYTHIASVHLFRKISELLCELKPKNQNSFFKYMSKLERDYFKVPSPISILNLENSELKYDSSIK